MPSTSFNTDDTGFLICPVCGSFLCGDGYKTVYHCIDAEYDTYCDHEPDAHPVYCVPMEDKDHADKAAAP